MRLVLTCRDVEWPKSEGKELLQLWGSDSKQGIYRLKQLRWKDAHQAAIHWGASESEAAAFMEAVEQRAVEAFAARPITLRMLFREFEQGGQLPQSRIELFRRACLRLCEEDEDRARRLRQHQPSFNSQELYVAASRIAIRTLLGRRSGISTLPVEKRAKADLGLDEIVDEKTDTGFSAKVKAVLDRALFADGGNKRRVFAHPTYGEFLAAERLAQFSVPQLKQLLSKPTGNGRTIIPQLAEMTAWVALMSPPFLDWMIECEPEVLLRNDASTLSEEAKRGLVVSLLERVAQEKAFDEQDLQRYYESLDFPGLPDAVRPYITNKKLNRVVRRMAIHLADFCKRTEVLDECLQVALDPNDEYYLRIQAMHAVRRWIPEGRLLEIEPLAKGERGLDPDDELRAIALEALVPKRWRVSRATSLLRKPWNQDYIGQFNLVFSAHLPKSIEADDLPALFVELAVHPHPLKDYRNTTKAITERALVVAVQNLNNSGVASALVRFFKDKLRNGDLNRYTRDDEWNTHFGDSLSSRRQYIECLLADSEFTGDAIHHLASLNFIPIHVEDCDWVLDKLASASKRKRLLWVRLAAGYFWKVVSSPSWENYLDACARVPELKALLKRGLRTELGTPEARNERESWKRSRAAEREKEPRATGVTAQGLFDTALEKARKSAESWPELAWSIQRETDEREIKAVVVDLTQRRLWRESPLQIQRQLTDIAKRFLLEQCFEPTKGKLISDYRMPGFWAIWLLRDTVETDPELAAALRTKWLGVLVECREPNSQEAQQLMRLAMKLDPERCRKFLSQEMEAESKTGAYLVSSLSAFQLAWDKSLTSIVLKFVEEPNLSAGVLRDALFFLGKYDKETLKAWLSDRISKLGNKNNKDREKSAVFAAVSIACFAATFWKKVWPRIKAHKSLAQKACKHVVFAQAHRSISVLGHWTEEQLSEVYLRLEQVFPSANDPEWKNGEVTDGHNLKDFRRYLRGTLEARANAAACGRFLWLASQLPGERTWLRWHWKSTFTAMLKNEWKGVQPSVIAALEAKTEARWVTSHDDLLELIADSLSRFQERLQPVVHRLWNIPPPRLSPKPEKFLSREICDWLETDLGQKNRIVAGCEVQPSLFHANDILVSARPNTGDSSPGEICVVLEVKRHFHPKVATALENQLVADYLTKYQRTRGIYVVGWYNCPAWQKPSALKADTYSKASVRLTKLVEDSRKRHPDLRLASICLDCGYPQSSTTKLRTAESHRKGPRR